MPHDILAVINKTFNTAIRVDIVPIVRPGDESYLERLDKEYHSAFIYFDRPIDYSAWSNGIKGGKQTRVYTGCWMTPVPGVDARPFNEFWVLIPNNPKSVIPYTAKTTEMLEHELDEAKEAIYKIDDLELFNKELEIWEYDWNCVQFHKALFADAPVDVCQAEFDKINCAWVSIHQVAANVERLSARVM